MPERRTIVAAALLALALNLAGIGWGLPSRFHPDEKADVVAAMVRERRLLPDSYVNPSLPLHRHGAGAGAPAAPAGRAARAAGRTRSSRRAPSRRWPRRAAVLLLGLAASRVDARARAALAALLLAAGPRCREPRPLRDAGAAGCSRSRRSSSCSRDAARRGPGAGLGPRHGARPRRLDEVHGGGARARRRSPPSGCGGAARRRARTASAWLSAAARRSSPAASPSPDRPATSLAASLHLPDARLLHPESARAFVHGLARAAIGLRRARCSAARWPSRGWTRTARLGGASSSAARWWWPASLRAGAFVVGTPGARRRAAGLPERPRLQRPDAPRVQGAGRRGHVVVRPTSALAGDALTLPGARRRRLLGLAVAAVARPARGETRGLRRGARGARALRCSSPRRATARCASSPRPCRPRPGSRRSRSRSVPAPRARGAC